MTYRELLERERDHWRAALKAFEGNDTVDIDYSSALRAESDLTRALLAQPDREGELVVALELAKQKAEQIRDGQSNSKQRARAIIQVARAALAQGEKE